MRSDPTSKHCAPRVHACSPHVHEMYLRQMQLITIKKQNRKSSTGGPHRWCSCAMIEVLVLHAGPGCALCIIQPSEVLQTRPSCRPSELFRPDRGGGATWLELSVRHMRSQQCAAATFSRARGLLNVARAGPRWNGGQSADVVAGAPLAAWAHGWAALWCVHTTCWCETTESNSFYIYVDGTGRTVCELARMRSSGAAFKPRMDVPEMPLLKLCCAVPRQPVATPRRCLCIQGGLIPNTPVALVRALSSAQLQASSCGWRCSRVFVHSARARAIDAVA